MSSYKKDLNVKITQYKYSNPEGMISILVKQKASFYIRQTADLTSIIVGDKEFLYPSKRLFQVRHLFIFNSVRKDVRAYLKKHPGFKAPQGYPTNKTNYEYVGPDESLTGTDINGAYWKIAHMMGFISDKTFRQGEKQEKGMKVARLAGLSTLGTKRTYDRWENGEKVEVVVAREANEEMKEVYKAIRYSCYAYMNELITLLGDDFETYKTDAVFYRDTPENRALVHSYLTEKGFTFKQLKFADQKPDEDLGFED